MHMGLYPILAFDKSSNSKIPYYPVKHSDHHLLYSMHSSQVTFSSQQSLLLAATFFKSGYLVHIGPNIRHFYSDHLQTALIYELFLSKIQLETSFVLHYTHTQAKKFDFIQCCS